VCQLIGTMNWKQLALSQPSWYNVEVNDYMEPKSEQDWKRITGGKGGRLMLTLLKSLLNIVPARRVTAAEALDLLQ